MRLTQSICCLFISLLLLLFPQFLLADITPGSIALISFSTDKAGKYAKLGEGLRAMLANRLAGKEGITVIDGRASREDGKELATGYPGDSGKLFQKIGVEYIGTGTLVQTEDGLRFELIFFSSDGGSTQAVSATATSEKDIIATVDELAEKIGQQLFGYGPGEVETDSQVQSTGGTDAFQTAHPDRQYKEEIISGVAVFSGEEFTEIAQGDVVRRRSSLAEGAVALAAANVDGEPGEEIFVASESGLKAFRYERDILKQLSEYRFAKGTEVHALNISDVNSDGVPEIYVSASRNDRLSSAILQWNGNEGFSEVVGDIRWAIRPLETPDDGLVVLGQRQSLFDKESFFEPSIYILTIDQVERTVTNGKRLFIPPQFNLFDFIYADVYGDGVQEKVGITSSLKLAVFDRNNRLTWISEENYGGSVKYLGQRWRTQAGDETGAIQADDENYFRLQYVPPRLLAEDINGDGKTDIITAKNRLSSFQMLNNFRSFSGGKAVCLSWNGIKMTEIWQTDTLDGYVSDVDFIIDTKSLGEKIPGESNGIYREVRLFVGQVPSSGFGDILNFLGDKANLVVYRFKIQQKNSE